MKRKFCAVFVLLLVVSTLLTGCGKHSEIGKWHVDVDLGELGGNKTALLKKLLNGIGIKLMLSIDVEFFGDGTFKYVINTDELEKTLSEFSSSLVGMLGSAKLSDLVEEIVGNVLGQATGLVKTEFSGRYTKDDEGLIIATDGISLFFQLQKSELRQISQNGGTLIVLKKM